MTRAPAPSHTAVEPVAWLTEWKRDGEDWINAHANEVTALDEARAYSATITPLVPLSTLTAQAAARVAAEKERDEARANEDDGLAWDALAKCKALLAAERKTLKARIAELEAKDADATAIFKSFLCIDFQNFTEHDELLLEDTIREARRLTEEKSNG